MTGAVSLLLGGWVGARGQRRWSFVVRRVPLARRMTDTGGACARLAIVLSYYCISSVWHGGIAFSLFCAAYWMGGRDAALRAVCFIGSKYMRTCVTY